MFEGFSWRRMLCKRGHFLLSSGRHSGEYWEKFWVLQWPCHVETLCSEIAQVSRCLCGGRARPDDGRYPVGARGGRQLGVRALYAEKEDGQRMLRRGLRLPAGTRTLIVDDILTRAARCASAWTWRERMRRISWAPPCLWTATAARWIGLPDGEPAYRRAETYAPEGYPLCEAGVPLVKPGTSKAVTASS